MTILLTILGTLAALAAGLYGAMLWFACKKMGEAMLWLETTHPAVFAEMKQAIRGIE